MVEVMKIMVTSFKMSHVCTTARSAFDPAAGHCQSMPLSETSGQPWACLGQFLVGSTPPFPRVWYAEGFLVPSWSLFPQSCVNSGGSMVGLMAPSSMRAYARPRSTAPRAPAPAASHRGPTPLPETPGDSQASLCQSSVHVGCRRRLLSSLQWDYKMAE